MLTAVAVVVDGLVYAAWLFLVALGLTLIYGVLNVLNIAHGAFYAFGAYTAATTVGFYLGHGFWPAGVFLFMTAAAILVGVVLGFVMERGLLRRFEGHDEVILVLVTYAASLILEDVLVLVWGGASYYAFEPVGMVGQIEIGSLWIAGYDLALVGTACVLGFAAWHMLRHTVSGKIVRAVIHDREMAAAFGVNVRRVFTLTFIIGTVLAVIAGVATAPKISVTPGIGVEIIVLAFAIVAIGGTGSIAGAAIGALAVGFSRSAAVQFLPEVELFVVYAIMSLVLIFRPQGLFARRQARRI